MSEASSTSLGQPAAGYRWHAHADTAACLAVLADQIGACIDDALAVRGRAVLALAGGKTPMPLYRALADRQRDWSRVHVFPTDERWVDLGHPARNQDEMGEAFRNARGIQLHGLLGRQAEYPPSAGFACQALSEFSEPFDVVLLGMGRDAHTASLFPHGGGLMQAWHAGEGEPACVVVPDPLPADAPYPRITLSRPRLRHARLVVLLITGAEKRAVFEQVSEHSVSPDRPISGFLDAELGCYVHWSP